MSPHNDWLATSQWVLVVSCVFVVVQGQQEYDGSYCAWAFGPSGLYRCSSEQPESNLHPRGQPAYQQVALGALGAMCVWRRVSTAAASAARPFWPWLVRASALAGEVLVHWPVPLGIGQCCKPGGFARVSVNDCGLGPLWWSQCLSALRTAGSFAGGAIILARRSERTAACGGGQATRPASSHLSCAAAQNQKIEDMRRPAIIGQCFKLPWWAEDGLVLRVEYAAQNSHARRGAPADD